MTTAAAIIIGDEILSGKVRDANSAPLIDLFADIGVELQRISCIGDAEEDIIAEVRSCSERYDAVITSGGVGPTHDDRTVAAIATAFGVEVERHPELVEMIHAWWGKRFTEAALRMAEIPAGSRLIYSNDGLIPMVAFRNVYIFPGIPRLFAAKIEASAIADRLAAVDEAFPEVKIGSYPRSEGEDHRVWITVEAGDAGSVNTAVDGLLEALSADDVVRVVRPV